MHKHLRSFFKYLVLYFMATVGYAQFALPSFQATNKPHNLAPTMTITSSSLDNLANYIVDGGTSNHSALSMIFTSNESIYNFFVVDDITVSGGSISSFAYYSSSVYTAVFTPSGDGAKTIDVGARSYTDVDGNHNIAADQFNWTYDGTLPTITGNSLASNNSTISATFNEAVFNSSGGSGALQISDFNLTLTNGLSSLVSSTPTGISSSGNTYTLNINLSGVASAAQTLTINPSPGSIYDALGNIASSSQSNNTVNFNDMNYVLNLNGSNEYADLADNSAFEPDYWTIQAWIDPSAVPSNSDNDWFIHKNKVYRLGLQYTLSGVEITGSIRYSGSYHNVNSGDQNFYVTSGGGWYHVVLTFDGTNLVLYVNGDEKDTNSNSSYSTNNTASVFSIGRRSDTGTYYYNGIIDEVAFWNTPLGSAAVIALYNSGSGLNALKEYGSYTSLYYLVMYQRMQQNLNDSDANYNFSGNNISSDDYDSDPID